NSPLALNTLVHNSTHESCTASTPYRHDVASMPRVAGDTHCAFARNGARPSAIAGSREQANRVPVPKRENHGQLVCELERPLWPAGDNAARRRRVLPGAASRNVWRRNGLVL